MLADEFIVSHGPQSAVGHHMGSGQIRADEPIVINLWPRDRETGCFADMTRTYVVGEAPAELVEFHRLVKEALEKAIGEIRAGVPGRELMVSTCEFFQQHGYRTPLSKEPGEVLEDGSSHGLGHGVGLEVHEEPGWASRVATRSWPATSSPSSPALQPGVRRLPPRGPDPGHRRRRREPHGLPVRPRALRPDRHAARRGAPISAVARVRRAGECEGGHLRARRRRPLARRGRPPHLVRAVADAVRMELPYAKWYVGGKLNVCFDCVDRHVEAGLGDRVAYHWEGEPGRHADDHLCRPPAPRRPLRECAQGARRAQGHAGRDLHGDGPRAPVAMLACTRLGAPHTVVFGGFSADSLSSRMNDMGCEVLVTQDEAWRRGSTVPLKRTPTTRWPRCPACRSLLVVSGPGNDVPMTEGRDRCSRRPSRTNVSDDPASCPASRWTPRTCSS